MVEGRLWKNTTLLGSDLPFVYSNTHWLSSALNQWRTTGLAWCRYLSTVCISLSNLCSVTRGPYALNTFTGGLLPLLILTVLRYNVAELSVYAPKHQTVHGGDRTVCHHTWHLAKLSIGVDVQLGNNYFFTFCSNKLRTHTADDPVNHALAKYQTRVLFSLELIKIVYLSSHPGFEFRLFHTRRVSVITKQSNV